MIFFFITVIILFRFRMHSSCARTQLGQSASPGPIVITFAYLPSCSPVVCLPVFLFVSHSHYYVNMLLSIFALRSPQGRGAVQRFCEICVCRGDSQWSARSDEPVFIVLCASVALYILFCHRGRLTAESLGPTELLSVCACCGRFVCFLA